MKYNVVLIQYLFCEITPVQKAQRHCDQLYLFNNNNLMMIGVWAKHENKL